MRVFILLHLVLLEKIAFRFIRAAHFVLPDLDAEQLLQTASGNAGMIGPGTSGGDAKRGQLEDEEENEFFEDDIESAWKIK